MGLLSLFRLVAFTFLLLPETVFADKIPLIGITSGYSERVSRGEFRGKIYLNVSYIDEICAYGAIPVVIPPLRGDDRELISSYVEQLDGLILSGGPDIPPMIYGEEPHESVKPLHERRITSEMELVTAWLKRGKPILGICLGQQVVNVALGGTLIQDIPSTIKNSVFHRGDRDVFHLVNIEDGSFLKKIMGRSQMIVNSYHHQAIKDLGEGLVVSSRSLDGVIESVELPNKSYALFVQWHPERMDHDHEHVERLFGSFIQAAKNSTAAQCRSKAK